MAYFLAVTEYIRKNWLRFPILHYEQWGAMEEFIKKNFKGNYATDVGPDHSEWTAKFGNPFYATLFCELESDAEIFKSVFDKIISGPLVGTPYISKQIYPTNAPPPPSAASWTPEWLDLYPPQPTDFNKPQK
jgi:hypothetical protein